MPSSDFWRFDLTLCFVERATCEGVGHAYHVVALCGVQPWQVDKPQRYTLQRHMPPDWVGFPMTQEKYRYMRRDGDWDLVAGYDWDDPCFVVRRSELGQERIRLKRARIQAAYAEKQRREAEAHEEQRLAAVRAREECEARERERARERLRTDFGLNTPGPSGLTVREQAYAIGRGLGWSDERIERVLTERVAERP